MDRYDLLSGVSTMEIGTTLSTFLFGISTLQAYTYYLRFPKDRVQLKALAFSVWALELGHAISILHFFYTFSILQYGVFDYMALKPPLSLVLAAIFDGLLSILVSGFFTDRVRRLTWNTPLAIICFLLSFLRLVALMCLATLGALETEQEFLAHRKWLVITSATIGATADVLIATALSYNLYQRRKAHFDISVSKRTLKMLDQLIVDTLRTGLVTSLMSLALAICLLTMAESLTWIAIFVCQARAFTNSFFGALNGRTSLRPSNSTPKDTALHSIRFAKTRSNPSEAHTSARLTFLVTTTPTGNEERRSRAYTFHDSNLSSAGVTFDRRSYPTHAMA